MFSKTENGVEIFSRYHPMSARRAANGRRLTASHAGVIPFPFWPPTRVANIPEQITPPTTVATQAP